MAVGDAHVFPGFPTPVLTQLSVQSHRLLALTGFSVTGENTQERKFASMGYETHNRKVMSQTRSPLSNPDGAHQWRKKRCLCITWIKVRMYKVCSLILGLYYPYYVCFSLSDLKLAI